MHLAGYRVRLDRQLQLTHHKRYTLACLARSDFFGRAVPWTRLMLEKVIFQNDLNTRINNIISIPVGFVILAAPLAAICLGRSSGRSLSDDFRPAQSRVPGLSAPQKRPAVRAQRRRDDLVRLHLERRRCFGSLAGYLLDRAKIHKPAHAGVQRVLLDRRSTSKNPHFLLIGRRGQCSPNNPSSDLAADRTVEHLPQNPMVVDYGDRSASRPRESRTATISS